MPFLSDHSFAPPGHLFGSVHHSDVPGRSWWVGLFVDTVLANSCLADRPLPPGRGGPGAGGFDFSLLPERLDPEALLRLEVLNTGHVIAEFPVATLLAPRQPGANAPGPGRIDQVHGLTLSGLIEDGVTGLPDYELLALEQDRVVGRTRVWRWQHVGAGDDITGRAARFDLHLDPALADGRPHRIRIQTETGRTLAPGPVEVLAWPGQLRQSLAREALGGQTDAARRQGDRMLERLLGASAPLSAYAGRYPWLGAAGTDGGPETAPVPVLADGGCLTPIGATGWVLCHAAMVSPAPDLAAGLGRALALPGPTPALVLCDLGVAQADGQVWPLLFPAFDLERLLEQGHATLAFALPAAAIPAGARSLADLLLSVVLPADAAPLARERILHLPHPGGCLAEAALVASRPAREAALQAAVTARIGQSPVLPAGSRITPARTPGRSGFPALHLQRPAPAQAISLIIPTRNGGALLDRAVQGLIAAHPGHNLDLLIVDNGTTEPESLAVLDRLEQGGARILEYAEGFNYALINNLAAEHARHELLCFMNNDVDFPEPGVLDELSGRLADPTVGAAGPLMTRASDIIQHGGVVLGTWHGAAHAFEDRMLGDPGYAGLLQVAHETSAVTGALLLTRASLFERMGGFDARLFPVNFNDVDYCLRLGQAGLRTVFSPHVRILHLESASRGKERGTPAGLRMERELANLRARWREVLLDDPQFHPLFAIDSLPYLALAQDHRAPAPRRAAPRPAASLPEWT